MKVVILAGGYGTRISEESHLKPKPMIEIGDAPILWHVMKGFGAQGFNEFIICCGYRSYVIKEYFSDYYLHRCNVTFDFTLDNQMTVHSSTTEPWKVTLIDTGLDTMTGGRIKRIAPYIDGEPFMLTYGDGVSDVNLSELLSFHRGNGSIVTLTAIQPGGRFGTLEIDSSQRINKFAEKSREAGGWINAGFMVCQPEVFEYIDGDQTVFERDPLERLAYEGKLSAYKHYGFWQCMDTMRDKQMLLEFWESNQAPWKTW